MVDIETEEILDLLSARVKAEQAHQKELGWILKHQEYILAAVREIFEDISEEIAELKEIILSSDRRQASLRRQLATNMKMLNLLQEERAQRADQVAVALDHRIETLRNEIEQIRQELGNGQTQGDDGSSRGDDPPDQ